MKKLLLSFGFGLLLSTTFFAQSPSNKEPVVSVPSLTNKNIPTQTLPKPNLDQLRAEDVQRDKNGELYRIGVPIFTNITTINSGLWTTQPNGDRVWELKIKSTGAEALSFIFSNFKLYGNSFFTVSDLNGVFRHKPVYKADMLEDFQQHLALCFGDELILKLVEPAGTTPSEILMDRVMYDYRSTGNPMIQKINESASCEVNVNCSPVGDAWQDEKRGVARILITDASGQGWCSGSLVNNTAQDCKPLFLTALHCGVTTSAANSNLWKFYFRYESPSCTNPSTAGTLDDYFINGCVRKANSNDGGGNTGSDFLLLQLGSATNEAATIATLKTANFNAYWNGWDANNSVVAGGAGIHHPAGDIKKISTFTATPSSQTYGGPTANTHWRFSWSANSNGHGVTEGGSSGSPVFKSNGRIFGTLTGGSSFCNQLTAPDLYGKMSYHWTSNGTNTNYQLKTFLDPGNTGALVLDGSLNPCSVVTPTAPVANFVANQTNVTPGTTVTFTDQTTGVPTSWAWSVSPATGWAYSGGSSASTQNPQITFNSVGQYTITLVATNGQGSDSEVKTNYIIVAASTGPCAASSTAGCAATSNNSYISSVQLNTLNNTSTCSGYTNFSSLSTTLTKGNQYNATLIPSTTTANAQGAYTNDELAIWIDYNNDNDFLDAGEQVGYVLVVTGWSNVFSFTVPPAASVGNVKMRVRISYQPDDGAIVPCGNSQWGEVEDYTINIQAAAASVLTLSCGSNQTIYASSQTTMPNLTSSVTSNTTCAGGAITLTQAPPAGTGLTNGANTVTITATDNCGNSQQCQMTVTYINNLNAGELNMFSAVTIYPNPVTDNLIVDLSTVANEDITIEIYDLSGKLLVKENNQKGSLISIDISDLSNGFYQIKLLSSTAQIMKRISKM
jgi:PKD repeat protein